MHLVVDGSGSGYGLIVEDSDFLHGGRVIPSDTGTHLFYTRRGDKLEFDLGAEEFTYEFSAGENGYLRVIAPDSNERDEVAEPAMLSSVWNAFEKKEGDYADALHFILVGSDALPVVVEAIVTLDSREFGFGVGAPSLELELYRLDFKEDWNLMLSSGSLIRIKKSESGEFDYHLSRLMPVSLSRGTYLVQLRGLSEFSAAAEIRARFDRMDTISAVNGSTFYHRSRTSMSHQFGFELFGEKVKDVLIRSVGPGLEYFEMDGRTLNPRLTVSKNGFKRWSNEDWGLGIQTASQMATLMESSARSLFQAIAKMRFCRFR